MPAARKTNQSNRLTAAGLIAVTAATLLMMAWAIFPNPAFADGTLNWAGNGADKLPCPNGAHWILAPAQNVTGAVLHVGGQTITMDGSNGNNFDAFSVGPVDLATAQQAFVTYTGSIEDSTKLTVSSCAGGTTTTTTPTTTTTTPTTTTTTTTSTTTTTTPTTTTTTPTTTTTTPTTTTTTPTTTTTTPTTTTTTPGGGGGGGGGGTTTVPTTTTTIPTVAPTTIHKSTSTETTTDEVLATTVRPGGTAFTGVENVVPIGAIALTLMTSGTGLLWAGSRRRRRDGSEDED